jgi:3-oxoacyl-[acyl-carrier-protein] synthase II
MIAASPERRVVITGIGVISPIGNNAAAFWNSLVEGHSGVSALAAGDHEDCGSLCAGRVADFTGRIEDFGELESEIKRTIRKSLKLMNRETQMAVAATQQALADAGFHGPGLDVDPERVGVCFGAGNVSMLPEDFVAGIEACTKNGGGFDFARWGADGLPQVAPIWLLKCLPNMPACHIAMYNDLRGPNNSITQREAAANIAVAEARNLILDGVADAMIAGGTGTTILPFNLLHSAIEEDLARDGGDPAAACRPFDRNRRGAVLGEGAAAFVLEDMLSALGRGAKKIYGEIAGAGSSCAIDRNHVPKCRQALVNAMKAALRSAGATPDEIDHVHAHGLSTLRSDADEASAIRDVFGTRTDRLPVVAAKSHTGNAGAGSGALELAASLLALEHGTLFPVLNYEDPDPECPIAPVNGGGAAAGSSFLNLSLLPHGQASCVLVKAYR